MEKKNKNKKEKKVINDYNILGINIQIGLTILVVVFSLLGLIVNKKLFTYLYLFIALDLMAMAYNNKRIYNRPGLTMPYLVIGIVMLVYAVLKFIGVI